MKQYCKKLLTQLNSFCVVQLLSLYFLLRFIKLFFSGRITSSRADEKLNYLTDMYSSQRKHPAVKKTKEPFYALDKKLDDISFQLFTQLSVYTTSSHAIVSWNTLK